jgi:putative DNA primase/helicase
VKRFIICEPETALATALWIAFSWSVDFVDVAPLAVITAPEKRCGKSQLLNLIARLSRRPLVASNISPAAVFRVIEAHCPTLLIDEADAFMRDNEEMRGLLNSGHTRQSAFVVRTVGDEHEPKIFSTWGAKAVSGIGHLPETLMDRAVILELRRKLPSEKVDRLRHAEKGLFSRLSSMLARWAEDNGAAIERSRPALPDALNDRAQDNWEPLLAIADIAGGEWPKLARDAALKISGSGSEAASLSAELLGDVQQVFASRKTDRIASVDLLAELVKDEEAPWATYNRGKPMSPRQLAKRLGEYGIKPNSVRIGTATPKGFMRHDFDDVFARYLTSPANPPPTSATAQQSDNTPSGSNAYAVADNAQRCGNKTLSATHNSLINKDCCAVADTAPLWTEETL